MKVKESKDEFQEKPALDFLKDFIRRAPERTEKEFQRTSNPWMACFASNVFVIEARMHLHSDELKNALSEEGYRKAQEKLQKLKERFFMLKGQYPDRHTDPPDDLKGQLMDQLSIFE